jgi:hypothetical protein
MPSLPLIPTDCINLLETYGAVFRIAWDEAYDARGVRRSNRDPWAMQIPCAGRGLVIYPHGGTILALGCDYRPGIARQVAAIPGVRIHQDGGMRGEMTFVFDVSLFDAIAAIVKPRRRRRLSEEHRARLVAAGRPHLRSGSRSGADLEGVPAAGETLGRPRGRLRP